MTSVTDVCNRMLQKIGTRTTVTDAELAGNSSNEAIQFNLIYTELRDQLLQMAPWNCAMRTANLTYITSSPGTPENTSSATTLWSPGQPAPPWSYEYAYPTDCLMARWIIPSTQTGFADAVPVTTAVTGGASSYWWGQPIRFKIQIDQFYMVSAADIDAAGTDYAVGDYITLALQPNAAALTNLIGTFNAGAPQGAPAILQVTSIGGGGAVTGVQLVDPRNGEATPQSGAYFYPNATNPATQGSTTGGGSGATFNLTWTIALADQRVLLTNQEFATLSYTRQAIDPNVFDPGFREALYTVGGGQLAMALKGDRNAANTLIQLANDKIKLARGNDGNEGLTINDVTPDWIRVRGINYTEGLMSGPYQGYDWGSYFPLY